MIGAFNEGDSDAILRWVSTAHNLLTSFVFHADGYLCLQRSVQGQQYGAADGRADCRWHPYPSDPPRRVSIKSTSPSQRAATVLPVPLIGSMLFAYSEPTSFAYLELENAADDHDR